MRIPVLVEGKENRIYRWAVWLYLFLLIFEGALRKWILPGLATPLLLVREPIVIWLVLNGLTQGWFRSKYVKVMVYVSTFALISTVLFGHHNPFVAFFGWRIYFFHFPMIYVIERVLTKDDLYKMMKFILYVSIFMTVLVVIQFYSPETAWVNRGVGGIGTAGFSGAKGYNRPPGTFSFTNGYVGFQGIVGCCLLFYLMMNGKMEQKHRIPFVLLAVMSVCYLISIPTSISRSHFFQTAVFVIFLTLAALRKNDLKIRFINSITVVGIAMFVLMSLGYGGEQIDAFTTRFDNANESEGGVAGVVGGRYFGSLINPILTGFDVPLLGYGLGLGTNAGASLMGGNMYSFGFNAEGEWGRMIGESGLIMGLIFIFIRLSLSLSIFVRAYKRMVMGNGLFPWILSSYVLLSVPQGQWGQPTPLGMSVMACGLAMVSLKNENL